MEDKPIAAHGLGRGLAVDLLAILARGEVPEAVEVTCSAERFLVVNLAILRLLFKYQPISALFRAFTINKLFFL